MFEWAVNWCVAWGVWLGIAASAQAAGAPDWTERDGTWSTQSYWQEAGIPQRYTFSANDSDKVTGDSSVQVHMQVGANRPGNNVELRLALSQPLDLSQAEAVEVHLKVTRGHGLKLRDVFFCSPGFKKLAIAGWPMGVDVSSPGQWQRAIIDLTDARVIDKTNPAPGTTYDRCDVATVCLNFRLPVGAVDTVLLIDGIRTTKLPPLSVRRKEAEKRRTRQFWQWRAQFPERDLSPRPEDGRNLALSLQKLTHGISPERPFLIWGIGPSYLNFLGDGTDLICHLRKRFPNAPPIVYKKHVGSSVPWRFVLGWANHLVVPEQPDLVLLYGIGLESDLAKIFRTLRRHTTADIIVASVHWKADDIKNWGVDEDATNFANIPEMRRVCRKYGVEFVENRREWAQYLRDHDMKIEVDPEHGLLQDAVHQSKYGALVINENIVRHFAERSSYAYDPATRERRLPLERSGTTGSVECAEALGPGWTVRQGLLTTSDPGSRVKVRFTGNRIDLIATRSPDGGSMRVVLDGLPADDVPCFIPGPITCGVGNTRPERGSVGDIGPHGISLGDHLVPQTWTILLTDDDGNYEVTGSVTGPDGAGNVLRPFVSSSGQISILPELWRHGSGCVPFLNPWDGKIINRSGDSYTFVVKRACAPTVSFRGKSERFRVKLFQNLPNREHILELIVVDEGEVAIEAFDVFEPPLR